MTAFRIRGGRKGGHSSKVTQRDEIMSEKWSRDPEKYGLSQMMHMCDGLGNVRK